MVAFRTNAATRWLAAQVVTGAHTIPSFATAVGYNTITFVDDFNNLNTVDTGQTDTAGFNWYTDGYKLHGGTSPGSVYSINPAGVLAISGNTLNGSLANFWQLAGTNLVLSNTDGSAQGNLPPLIGSQGFYIVEQLEGARGFGIDQHALNEQVWVGAPAR